MTAQRRLDPTWIAAAAVTVLSSAAVAAVTLASTPVLAAAPAPQATGQVVAAYRTAPTPVTLSFPAPVAPAPVAPVTAPPAAPAPPAAAPVVKPAAVRRVNPMCDGTGWQQRRGAAAIARLRRPADARAVPVAFRPARSDVLGMADLHERRVDVFVRSCAKESDGLLLHVIAHELGHVLDATRMTGELRTRWMELRGIPAGTPWFGCDRCADFATPAGDFAETYAQWQRGASSNRSQLAPAPSRAQLAELARTFFSPL